jgi:hypothetical protein
MDVLTYILYQNISQEIILERTIYTYAYLSVLLHYIPTGKQWKQQKETILEYIQSAKFGFGTLPILNLSNRMKALEERKKQMEFLNQIMEYFPHKKKWREIRLAKQEITQTFTIVY